MTHDIQEIFRIAYEKMNEPIIEGNCGELCGFHCCRSHESDEALGMYLLPLEFEAVQKNLNVPYEVHSSKTYDLKGVKKQYYIFCHNDSGCLRNHRPIQCRTYPLVPHLENENLHLVIDNEQLHDCPLIHKRELWREAYIKGVYEGWQLLLTLKPIKKYIRAQSKEREHYISII